VKITVHIIIIIIIYSHSIDRNLVTKPMDMEIVRGLNREREREGEGGIMSEWSYTSTPYMCTWHHA
jgi:hypothetical protein